MMWTARILMFFALGLCLAGPATANKVYQGREAAALRCAAILSVVPSAAARAGYLQQDQVRAFHIVSTMIMTRYVSGDPQQKGQAFNTVMQRYTFNEHIRDFRTKSSACMKQFPVR
ncbi:MAG: hypothetical protein AB8B71_15790 [Paracoccaceae bacterium]